jgi:UDP-N-acetylmuramoylalanine--D-glutamate ligase
VKVRPILPGGPYLVVGLARSGIAAALALRARGEEVLGVDAGAPAGLDALVAAGVELHLGEQGMRELERVATVVKSPGVPAGAPVVAEARARGMCVMGELELAWRLIPNEIVAVTGTNGKTTTVEWIGHIHRQAGLPVAVAGNVGAALSGFVGRLDPDVTVACEVSSFQLEDALAFAPEVAVLLNIAPDHLDRHETLAAYTRAKLQIFAHQGPTDVAVLPAGLDVGQIPGVALRVSFGDSPDAELSLVEGTLRFRGEELLSASEVGIPGGHNLENAMAAAAACLTRGLDPDAVRAGLRSFSGVAHRLERLPRKGAVSWVNDSKATNVASTLVALQASADLGPRSGAKPDARRNGPTIHLILGGQGKEQDFAPLRAAVAETCRAVYLIGEDAPLIERALDGSGVPLHVCHTLERAVERARESARDGDVVLLSPACASFDQFADYEARGERFRELTLGL